MSVAHDQEIRCEGEETRLIFGNVIVDSAFHGNPITWARLLRSIGSGASVEDMQTEIYRMMLVKRRLAPNQAPIERSAQVD